MKKIAFLMIIVASFLSATAFSEMVSVPYITNVTTLPNSECHFHQGGNYSTPYCLKVDYSQYKANLPVLDQKPPYLGSNEFFGLYSKLDTRRANEPADIYITIRSDDTRSWRALLDEYMTKIPSSGSMLVELPGAADIFSSCVAFGVFTVNWGGAMDVMLPSSNTCVPIPKPDVSCSFNINDINFSFGTLNTKSIDGATQNKNLVVNCTEDADVIYSLVNAIDGVVSLTSDTTSSVIQGRLSLDGNSNINGLKVAEKAGDNPHLLTATLENSNGADAGHYEGVTVLLVSPQ